MIRLSHLNKLLLLLIFLISLNSSFVFAEEDKPADIWEQKENQNEQNSKSNTEKKILMLILLVCFYILKKNLFFLKD